MLTDQRIENILSVGRGAAADHFDRSDLLRPPGTSLRHVEMRQVAVFMEVVAKLAGRRDGYRRPWSAARPAPWLESAALAFASGACERKSPEENRCMTMLEWRTMLSTPEKLSVLALPRGRAWPRRERTVRRRSDAHPCPGRAHPSAVDSGRPRRERRRRSRSGVWRRRSRVVLFRC